NPRLNNLDLFETPLATAAQRRHRQDREAKLQFDEIDDGGEAVHFRSDPQCHAMLLRVAIDQLTKAVLRAGQDQRHITKIAEPALAPAARQVIRVSDKI